MTADDIRKRVKEIEAISKYDKSLASSAESQLYHEFVRSLADAEGLIPSDVKDMAKELLRSRQFDLPQPD